MPTRFRLPSEMQRVGSLKTATHLAFQAAYPTAILPLNPTQTGQHPP
nr:hypothetical protein [uncultured Kingella sp.]